MAERQISKADILWEHTINLFIIHITEDQDSSKNKYKLFELACSQKTKWPEGKKLDCRFGKAYFKAVLLNLENHFTINAGLQRLMDAHKDCTMMGVASGFSRDSMQWPMNSKVCQWDLF